MQPIQNATFELWAKDNTGCLLKFYKKTQIFLQDFPRTLWKNMDFIPIKSNKNQSILCSYSGVITSQNELTTKARRSKKHSSFSVKYCKCLFFFLIFFHLFQFFHQLLFLLCFILWGISLSYQSSYATASRMLTTCHL